jgi:hypothetical protein
MLAWFSDLIARALTFGLHPAGTISRWHGGIGTAPMTDP